MAIEILIKFDGIDGESTNQDHKNEIDVLSWGWSLSAMLSAGGGAGNSVGRATAQDLHFVHHYDKSSPLLAKACASGKHIAQVTLAVRLAGGSQKDFLKITMKDVLISNASLSGENERGINESVSLRYQEIAFAYQAIEPSGQLGNPVKFGWNIATNAVT